jgi:hypothetical protein
MTISTKSPLRFCVYALILIAFTAGTSLAQPLTLEIKDFKTITLPNIRFKTLLLEDGEPRLRSDDVQYFLTENSVPVDFIIDCPSTYNSVVIIIDNLLNISYDESVSTYLRDVLTQFVDSLHPGDECMIIDSDGSVAVQFTSNKQWLRNAIAAMDTVGPWVNGYPMYYPKLFHAMRELSQRGGNRHCIILSARVWPVSPTTHPPESAVRDTAQASNIKIHPLLWQDGGVSSLDSLRGDNRTLRRISDSTGGRTFSLFVNDFAGIQEAFTTLSSNITSPYCSVSYTASGCTDSLRELELTATIGNRSVRVDTIMRSPFRPDTIELIVEAELEDVVPGNEFNVYVRLAPQLHKDLQFKFSFLIRYYPPSFQFLNPLLENATMTDGSHLVAEFVSPGVMRCTMDLRTPAIDRGNLLGWKFNVWRTDSSRPAYIVIDSVTLFSGCPNTVIAHPDTVYICNCERELPVAVQGAPVFTGEEVSMPVVLTDTLLYERALFSLKLHYDDTVLEPIGVEGVGTITENALLTWRIAGTDTLEVRADESFVPGPGRVLFNVRFRLKRPKAAITSEIAIPYVRAFSDCCYHQSNLAPNSILIDGLCNKVVRRRAEFTLEPNHPNPAREQTQFRFTVHDREGEVARPATLTLYRSDGTIVRELYNAIVQEGVYDIPYSIGDLSAGTYYYVLSIDGKSQTRSLVVLR